ncbi:hypothetical protein [Bradyrhizobium elkanii]|uniref:hypothetical protein n=1 Tax=Bradyrhizobium elkanii TaxID=29448 RepID=UPI0004BAACDA|nr:hypothetical protein [Bradyrhizobium elkanii]
MTLLQWGDWRPDTSDYEGTSVHSILNVVPRGDGYGPFPSFSAYTQALPATCRGAFYALKSDGSVITFAGTATKLYQLNNTNYSWTDVSKGATTYPSLSTSAQWQFAQFGSLVFATQANAPLQVFDLSSASAFSDCAGAPPQAAYISVVGRFLVLSGLLSQPYRIQWSGLNATTTWTSGVNSSDFQDFPDGGIVRGVAGGEFGVVFQDQAIRRMSYIPGSPLIFQIDRIAHDKGLFAPYSLVQAGEKIFFYAGQGFYKVEPGGVPEQIGREKVDRTFIADLDKANLQLFIGAADPRSTKVYWAYRSANGVNIANYDKIIGYDYLLERFFTLSVTGEFIAGISQTGLTLEALDAISSSIDALVLSLDSYATAVQPQIAQFNNAHILGFFAGNPLEATLESAEQAADGQRVTLRGFRPITDAPTVYGSVTYRDTQAVNSILGTEVLMNARTGRCDMMRDSRYIRYKQRIPAGTNWTFAAGVEPDVTTNGVQ